jgi:hypothetical protein
MKNAFRLCIVRWLRRNRGLMGKLKPRIDMKFRRRREQAGRSYNGAVLAVKTKILVYLLAADKESSNPNVFVHKVICIVPQRARGVTFGHQFTSCPS